jgi:nucleoside-diphosphate-sugar epimerase
LQSGYRFRADQTGGGVLAEFGPHVLDLLLWWLGGEPHVLSYKDDAFGGVEANCWLDLELTSPTGRMRGNIELANTRDLCNAVRIIGDRGTLEVPVQGENAVVFHPADPRQPRMEIRSPAPSDFPRSWPEQLGAQLSAFAASIAAGEPCQVPASEAVPVMGVIERCYHTRIEILQPWEAQSLERRASTHGGISNGRPRVLITGATGCIGGRLAERLCLTGEAEVRALVRTWSGPGMARLGRLPVELARGDLLDPPTLVDAAQGCDAVVHCAFGNSGTPETMRQATVAGTDHVLNAAAKAGARKLIYLSTAVVHGRAPGLSTVDESAPFSTDGDLYSESKAEAEARLWERARQLAIPVVSFRPFIVYGPHAVWTLRLIDEVRRGAALADGASGQASVVFVDNLVDAVILALRSDQADGEALFAVDDEHLTWADLYGWHAAMLGEHPPVRTLTLREIDSLRQAQQAGESCDGVVPDDKLVKLHTSEARFSNEKLKRLLRWEQLVPLDEGLQLTHQWLRFQGVL